MYYIAILVGIRDFKKDILWNLLETQLYLVLKKLLRKDNCKDEDEKPVCEGNRKIIRFQELLESWNQKCSKFGDVCTYLRLTCPIHIFKGVKNIG